VQALRGDLQRREHLSDCRAYCRPYLTNIVHLYSSHKLHPDQLHVLTIMVALTAVMTCVIMILLMFLMFLKMKKRKRLAKKINPNVLFSVYKEKIDLSQTKMEPLSAKELAKGERQESINTMMTQLSNNSSNHSDNLPTGPMRNSKTSASLNNRTKKLPSEGKTTSCRLCSGNPIRDSYDFNELYEQLLL